MDVQAKVSGLISTLRKENPDVWQALDLLNIQLHNVTRDLEPLVAQSVAGAAGGTGTIDPPSVSFAFSGQTVRFYWTAIDGAFQYECRLGSDWNIATFQFRTTNLTADIDPLLVGTYSFLFKSLDVEGNYSTDTWLVTVSVPQIPQVVLSGTAIDNNLLLTWVPPASVFDIDYYQIFKNGVSVGINSGTFVAYFEPIGGTNQYSIVAHDIAGNTSVNGTLFPFTVQDPYDFQLIDTRVSTLGGTKTNVVRTASPLHITCSLNTETWAVHFSSRGWTKISDQIVAGYPLYGQPTNNSGSYEEVVDYGTTLAQGILTVTWNGVNYDLLNLVNVVVKMATSTDNITYSAFSSGAIQFLTTFRYIKYRLEFTGSSTKSMLDLSNLTFNLAVKRQNDGGIVSAISTDVGGTTVSFNKLFKSVESITGTVQDNAAPFYVVIDFTSVPNPTSFKVLVFTAAGARASKSVRWAARGII